MYDRLFPGSRRYLVNAIRKKLPKKAEQLENVILHQDNAPRHTAETQLEISWIEFNQIAHIQYSPDLAPMDFAVFPCIKSELKGLQFTNDAQLKRATMRAVRKLDSRWCNSVFEKWVQRYKKCVHIGDIYFEKK